MSFIGIFLLLLIMLMFFRTILKNYTSKLHINLKSKKSMIVKLIIKFLANEFRLLIYFYIAIVGLYVLSERMFRYNIYPANVKSVNEVLLIIHDMNTNHLIFHLYSTALCVYVAFILPFRLIKLYTNIISNTNSKDYIHAFIVYNFSKLESKIKKYKNQ